VLVSILDLRPRLAQQGLWHHVSVMHLVSGVTRRLWKRAIPFGAVGISKLPFTGYREIRDPRTSWTADKVGPASRQHVAVRILLKYDPSETCFN
jgi:hypothetical protein